MPPICPICGAPLIYKQRRRWSSWNVHPQIAQIGGGSAEESTSLECNNDRQHKFYAYLAPKSEIYHLIKNTWARKYRYSSTTRVDYGSLDERNSEILHDSISRFPKSVDDATYAWILFPQKSLSKKLKFKGFWIVFENYKVNGFNVSFKFGYKDDERNPQRKKYILLEVIAL